MLKHSDIELPEVVRRFIHRVGDNEGSFTEQDMADPVNIIFQWKMLILWSNSLLRG